ncbi:MAG: response regulator [Deltaproteobacteria bacterium]|nr:MAG: response regulator [Deltaproteobacteria bacterium]
MPAHYGSTILVIEDQRAMRYLLQTHLGRHFEVVACRDGLEAFAWMAAGHIPALIVLDLSMPRLDGFAFLTQLRASGWYRDVPVIVVSADAEDLSERQRRQWHIQAVLTKPFDPQTLQQTVQQVLASTVARATH